MCMAAGCPELPQLTASSGALPACSGLSAWAHASAAWLPARCRLAAMPCRLRSSRSRRPASGSGRRPGCIFAGLVLCPGRVLQMVCKADETASRCSGGPMASLQRPAGTRVAAAAAASAHSVPAADERVLKLIVNQEHC